MACACVKKQQLDYFEEKKKIDHIIIQHWPSYWMTSDAKHNESNELRKKNTQMKKSKQILNENNNFKWKIKIQQTNRWYAITTKSESQSSNHVFIK